MAKIHISEIQKIMIKRGEKEAIPNSESGFFLEIRFDEPNHATTVIDEEFQNKTITADCPYGIVTIQFDEYGLLQLIDIS